MLLFFSNFWLRLAAGWIAILLNCHLRSASASSSSSLSSSSSASSSSQMTASLASPNPITKMVNPGDRINIPCAVMSPGGSVQWIRNGKAILLDFSPTQRRHYSIGNDGQSVSVTINRATKNDEGTWECWELDGQGTVKQKAHVMKLVVANVPEGPYLELDGKRLSSEATITVREKEALTLRCVVTGASPAVRQMSWDLGDENVTHSSQLLMEYSAQEDNYASISVLAVNVTKELHTKMVTCRAEHIAWPRPAAISASLNVLYEPNFGISREPSFGFPLIEGMAVSLKCEIDANPRSRAKWIKDGDVNQSKATSASRPNVLELRTGLDGALNFSSALASDSGWYRCTTDHEFGHFASFGYYLNVRTELPKLQQVLKLPLSPSYPPLSPPHSVANSINKESREQLARRQQQEGKGAFADGGEGARFGAHQAASVSNNAHMDIMVNSGLYGHNNQQKIANSLQTLYEQQQRQGCADTSGKPVVVAINRTVVAVAGRTITLAAEFCCSPRPKKIYWIHRHLAMAPGRIIGPYVTKELSPASNSRNCYTSTFDIEAVKPEDAGEISFIVSNAKGLDDVDIILNVTRAGFSISQAPSYGSHKWSFLFIVVLMLVLK